MDSDHIKLGDYVVIQRQKYTKLFKFSTLDSVAALGKDQVELKNINGHPYFTTFKMLPKHERGKRLVTLEASTEVNNLKETINVPITESGVDNRNLKDTTQSQALTQDDIEKLRKSGTSAADIVGTIVENSKTFTTKTEFSQDKYLRRKEKKYFEYLQIRRPTIRLIAEIMYRQDAEKILGLRIDSLSQLVSYSGVSSTGNYLLFESGTNGLVPATLLNSIGANTQARLLHVHQGNLPQKQAVFALNLEQEQLNRYICVNLYSVLRHFYQNSGNKRKIGEANEGENGESQPAKMAKMATADVEMDLSTPDNDDLNGSTAADESKNESSNKVNNTKTPQWVFDNERGCELLRENLDALVIVSKEHPTTIVNELLPFIKPSRPVVIFNTSREVLLDTYMDLKTSGKVTGLRLSSNWLRMYQILPNRTHPDVNMSANSGFLLCGFTIR